MNLKKAICLLLVFLMAVGLFAGCRKEKKGEEETKKPSSGSTVTDNYNREPQDLGGYEMNVLHVEADLWNMNTDLAPTTSKGDLISNAVFSRNEYIQDLYNCYITEHNNVTFYQMSSQIATLVMSGDCLYDAAYSEGSSVSSLVGQNYVENLYSLSALQLNESWWSQIVNREATLGDGKYATLYFTQSNLSLTAFDLTWCIYFNKKMYEEDQIEGDLYDSVREKTWTIEKLYSVAKQAAKLNGDENYTYSADGRSVYGMTTYWNGAKAMLIGGNIELVTRNDDDETVVSSFGESYVDLCGSLAKLFGEPGTFTYGGPSSESTTGNASDYLKIFNAERSLFLGAEVKSSVSDLKTFPGDFGILPMPMREENTEYRSWVNYLAPVLVIPRMSENPEKAAILLDVLSYYSDQEVLPIYYDKVLRGRGAKDPDSWEMLDIINESRCFEASIAYGWSEQFMEVVGNLVFQGTGSAASIQPDSYKELIQEKIDQTLHDVFGD